MESRLQKEIATLEQTLRRTRFLRELTLGWLTAATLAVALLVVKHFTGWISPAQWLVPLAIAFIAYVVAQMRSARRRLDARDIVAQIEREHPQLRHLLAAAAEQQPDSATGDFNFLQQRVVDEVLRHPQRSAWKQNLEGKLSLAGKQNFAVAIVLVIVLSAAIHGSLREHSSAGSIGLLPEITVTPGDTEVERGTSLVISARFGKQPPAEATLVLQNASGKTRRIPLERHLADPVFGASLSEVSEEGVYHVEYGGQKTRDYKISVFEFPALVRADAQLRFPAYTGLTNKTIPDTLRVSAVEGTRLDYTMQLNKPVTHARLVGREQTIELRLTNNAVAVLGDFLLAKTGRYSLVLQDAQGRTNKFPTEFVLVAVTNQRPALKLVFPRGDQRVSRLEEMQFQGEATDDFGLLKYGIGYTVGGADSQLIELGQGGPGGQKRAFTDSLALENLGVEVNQVVAYFAWADDFGPDGKERRTFTDIFFAEVRPFEEIFRADQSGMSGDQNNRNNQGGQQGGGNRSAQLAEAQKQIIIATWKLQREKATVASPMKP